MTKKLKLLDTMKGSQNIKTPWFLAAKSKQKEENMKKYEVSRNTLYQQINNIRSKTSKIWEENKHKTHSEQLEPNDIIIDVEVYDGKVREIESRSNHLRDKITDQTKKNLCRVNWLKKECIDKMEVPFCQLFVVISYAIPFFHHYMFFNPNSQPNRNEGNFQHNIVRRIIRKIFFLNKHSHHFFLIPLINNNNNNKR